MSEVRIRGLHSKSPTELIIYYHYHHFILSTFYTLPHTWSSMIDGSLDVTFAGRLVSCSLDDNAWVCSTNPSHILCKGSGPAGNCTVIKYRLRSNSSTTRYGSCQSRAKGTWKKLIRNQIHDFSFNAHKNFNSAFMSPLNCPFRPSPTQGEWTNFSPNKKFSSCDTWSDSVQTTITWSQVFLSYLQSSMNVRFRLQNRNNLR